LLIPTLRRSDFPSINLERFLFDTLLLNQATRSLDPKAYFSTSALILKYEDRCFFLIACKGPFLSIDAVFFISWVPPPSASVFMEGVIEDFSFQAPSPFSRSRVDSLAKGSGSSLFV